MYLDIPNNNTYKIKNSMILQNGIDLGDYNRICSWLERAVKTAEKQSKLNNVTDFCAGVITKDASYAVVVISRNNEAGFFAVHLSDGAVSPIIDAKMIKEGNIRLSETLSMRLENAAIMKSKGVDISPPIPKACIDAYEAMQKTTVTQLYQDIIEMKMNTIRCSSMDIDSDFNNELKNVINSNLRNITDDNMKDNVELDRY